MNFETQSQSIGFFDLTAETAEQSLEAVLHLPDYCPEIGRILRCAVDTAVTSAAVNGDRLEANASATLRLLYVGENGSIAAYEQNFPVHCSFALNAPVKASAVSVKVQTAYVNCRAVDPRRVEVKAMLSFLFRIAAFRKETFLTAAQGGGLQTMTETVAIADVIGITEKSFTLSEVAELPPERAPIARILHIVADPEITDVKLINNKALIKGSCAVQVYYLAEESGAVETLSHTLPISQILELEGMTESSRLQLQTEVRAAEAFLKADAAGAFRMAELSIAIHVTAVALEDLQLTLLQDAYATEGPVELQKKNAMLFAVDQQFHTAFTAQTALEPGDAVGAVLAVWCDEVSEHVAGENGNCMISGTCRANILYSNQDGAPAMLQKSVPFAHTMPLNHKADRVSSLISLQPVAAVCAVTADGSLELKTEFSVDGTVLDALPVRCVSEITAGNSAAEAEPPAALTIYFADADETLWEIARRYRTTVDAIRSENDLAGDRVERGAMLLIPFER